MLMQFLTKRQALPIRSFSNILALLFPDMNFCEYLIRSNFSEHKVINFCKLQMILYK